MLKIEMAAETAAEDIVKNVDKKNERFRWKNTALIPHDDADHGAPRENSLKNNVTQQDYQEVKHPDL